MLTASVLRADVLRRAVGPVARLIETRYRALFYAAFFVWSYSMSEMFDGLRQAYGLFAH